MLRVERETHTHTHKQRIGIVREYKEMRKEEITTFFIYAGTHIKKKKSIKINKTVQKDFFFFNSI